MPKTIAVIDGNSLMHRAYHAVPQTMNAPDGTPTNAIYGFFNRVSLHALQLDGSKCIHCGKCAAACRMCVDPAETPESAECIRCGKCVGVCPTGALHVGWKSSAVEK